MTKTIVPIEALRFFFTCIICLWHFNIGNIISNGYIVVEFFFILSGFFIYSSFVNHKEASVLDFTIKKLKRFIPPLIISLLLLVILDRKKYILISCITPDEILNKYYSHIHEFFFCQSLSLYHVNPINGPLWYISILLLGGGLIYGFLKYYNDRALSLFIPLFCIWGYNYLIGSGNHSLSANTYFIPGFYTYLVRGITEMGVGVLCAHIFKKKEYALIRNIKIINFISIFCLFGFILILFADNCYDYLSFFLIPPFIYAAMINNSLLCRFLSNSIWIYCGQLSLYMYFIHYFVASVFYIIISKVLIMNNIYIITFYIITVILFAFLLKKISVHIQTYIK